MIHLRKSFVKFYLTFIIISFLIFACNSPVESDTINSSQDLNKTLATMEIEDLSPAEQEGLLFMREEEKLARDVYITLYEKWNLRIFNNISQS